MYYKKLDDSNFMLFCAQNYNNNQCSGTEEFLEDVHRLKYIKKLITRYQETGELKERLILNHIIILNNVFGPQVLCRILFFKFKYQLKYIKPFLILLNILPEAVHGIGEKGETIITDDISMDENIVKALRKI